MATPFDPRTTTPNGGSRRPKVHDSELEACAEETRSAAQKAAASTPQPVLADRRTRAIEKLAEWAKELAPPRPTTQPT